MDFFLVVDFHVRITGLSFCVKVSERSVRPIGVVVFGSIYIGLV